MARLAPLLLLPLLAGLVGCTEDTPTLPPPPSTTAATKQAAFPIRVVRQGGPNNLDDRISIQPDGGVLATLATGQVTCTLDQDTLGALNDAAVRISRDAPPPSAPVVTPSGQAQVLIADSRTDLVSIDDARVGAAKQIVTLMLQDVTGPARGRIVCH